jgi:hypothetical protein
LQVPPAALRVCPDDPLHSLVRALGGAGDRAPGTGFGSGLFGAVPEFATDLFGEFLSISRTAGSRRTVTKSVPPVMNEFATDEPVFAVQVLIRGVSEIRGGRGRTCGV